GARCPEESRAGPPPDRDDREGQFVVRPLGDARELVASAHAVALAVALLSEGGEDGCGIEISQGIGITGGGATITGRGSAGCEEEEEEEEEKEKEKEKEKEAAEG